MTSTLESGRADSLPATLPILTELLEACLAGALSTEQWVFLAEVVEATTTALFHHPCRMRDLRNMSWLFLELSLRALEHIASAQTDLAVRCPPWCTLGGMEGGGGVRRSVRCVG